eukprot:scaffold70250_cov61-Phaeocystis_antarctica.AAC.2
MHRVVARAARRAPRPRSAAAPRRAPPTWRQASVGSCTRPAVAAAARQSAAHAQRRRRGRAAERRAGLRAAA